MAKTVYMVNSKPEPVKKILEEHGFNVLIGDGEKYNMDYLSRCWALMPGRWRVTAETLEAAPCLKLICKQGVGLDRIDVAACDSRGIHVVNTAGSNSISVAEHTIALMLACAKQLYPISKSIRCAVPDWGCTARYRAAELSSKTLAIIGFGNIGARVAGIAAAFGMRIVAYTRHPERYADRKDICFTDSLDEALSDADYVSLHVSGSEENRRLIGSRELSLMKKNAVIINTTRGFVIDEAALYEALACGRIAGAGLDVFEDEPLKEGNRLLGLENVVATPHSAANTPEANNRAYLQCADEIIRYAARLK